MDSADRCDQIRPLLCELAIGAASGHDRARVVRHIASCPICGRELAELTRVTDGLLLLAAPAEPSAGFESRVVARMLAATPRPSGAARRPVRRRGRALALAAGVLAAVLAGGAVGGAVTRAQGGDDRALADRYRQILSVADGQYLRALRLTTDSGAAAGTVFLYQGRPSWLLAAVTSAPEDGSYDMVVTDRNGTEHLIGRCRVAGGTGTTGYRLPTPVADITAIALYGPDATRLTARPS